MLRALFKEAMQKPVQEQEKFLEKFREIVGDEALMRAYYELYVFVHGCHFVEDTAKFAVAGMLNANHTSGESITKATADEWAKKMGLTWDWYNDWDWYYVVNMIASDFYGVVDQNTYYKLAKAWLEDKDVPRGKAFRYWCKVVKQY